MQLKVNLEPRLPHEVPVALGRAPREARRPAHSVQEIIQGDAQKAPAVLAHEHYEYLGSDNINFARYYSPEIFDREIEPVWRRTRQWACREEHVPEPGDYYVRAAKKKGQTLGNYQEVRIRHFQRTLDRYLAADVRHGAPA